jgi:hypothetical protein
MSTEVIYTIVVEVTQLHPDAQNIDDMVNAIKSSFERTVGEYNSMNEHAALKVTSVEEVA